MKVTTVKDPTKYAVRYTIEIPQIEAVKHSSSKFEKMTMRTYEVTHKISDFFIWMSEYARTEEERIKNEKDK
jgi:hypothetical protein